MSELRKEIDEDRAKIYVQTNSNSVKRTHGLF